MNNSVERIPAELLSAAKVLSENLQAAEPFVLYQGAQARMNADDEARSLLEQLSTLQTKMRAGQMKGSVTQVEIDQLRAVQAKVQQNQLITEYASAQQAAINYLRDINQEISGLLGIDFAALARSSNCC